MACFWTALRRGQNLRTFFGHQNCVLELSTKLAVLCPDCPAIATIKYRFASAEVDHWLDGEAHARVNSVDVGLSIWIVWD